jgi:hypothetical protein
LAVKNKDASRPFVSSTKEGLVVAFGKQSTGATMNNMDLLS